MAKDRLSMLSDRSHKKKLDGIESQSRGADGLTEKQRRFVYEFTRGPNSGNAAKSAANAGYGEKNSQQIAWALVRHKIVAAAIDAAVRAEIGGPLTVQAVGVIRAILTDKNAPLRLRGEMAAKVVEYSGIVDRTQLEMARETGLDGTKAAPKRLAEYSRGELETLVRNGAALLQAAAALPAAKPIIEGKPSDAPKDFQSNPPDKLSSLMVSVP